MALDPNEYITLVTGVAAAAGGFYGGKRLGNGQAQSAAVSTVELLQVAVAELERQGRVKDDELADLRGRVGILEDLVTQRAEVEAVHVEVKEVRGVVDRIASKVGA